MRHGVARVGQAGLPGTTARLVDWLKKYKTAEGKGLNTLASEVPYTIERSDGIIAECNEHWLWLLNGQTANSKKHYITTNIAPALTPMGGAVAATPAATASVATLPLPLPLIFHRRRGGPSFPREAELVHIELRRAAGDARNAEVMHQRLRPEVR